MRQLRRFREETSLEKLEAEKEAKELAAFLAEQERRSEETKARLDEQEQQHKQQEYKGLRDGRVKHEHAGVRFGYTRNQARRRRPRTTSP